MQSFPKNDEKMGRELLEKKALGEVLFSQGTYQIEIVDGESFWPFLQINDEGELTDGFCTCERYDETQSCAHLAASMMMIMGGEQRPLHVRFQDSLFSFVCKRASMKQNPSPAKNSSP